MFHRNIGHSRHSFWDISPIRPNWTFLTLKMTFRVLPHLSYFRIGLVSQKIHDAIHLGSTSLLQNNINNYGKMGQIWHFWPWKWPFDNSIKCFSWQLINIITIKLHIKNNKKLRKLVKSSKTGKFDLFSDLEKLPLKWFNQIHLLTVH